MISMDTKRFKHTPQLLSALQSKGRSLRGKSNAASRLASILKDYQDKLDKEKEGSSRFTFRKPEKTRPMNVYIFTNGVWQPHCDAATPIKRLVEKLESLRMPVDMVGIQFIRFGDNDAGKSKLVHLDSGLKLARYVLLSELTAMVLESLADIVIET